jgi:hypothetical protein
MRSQRSKFVPYVKTQELRIPILKVIAMDLSSIFNGMEILMILLFGTFALIRLEKKLIGFNGLLTLKFMHPGYPNIVVFSHLAQEAMGGFG